MELLAFLFTGRQQAPPIWAEYVLCCEMYHCTPSELDEQDWLRVNEHLLCREIEGQVRAHHQKRPMSRDD